MRAGAQDRAGGSYQCPIDPIRVHRHRPDLCHVGGCLRREVEAEGLPRVAVEARRQVVLDVHALPGASGAHLGVTQKLWSIQCE